MAWLVWHSGWLVAATIEATAFGCGTTSSTQRSADWAAPVSGTKRTDRSSPGEMSQRHRRRGLLANFLLRGAFRLRSHSGHPDR
jgi:hypothetical protein